MSPHDGTEKRSAPKQCQVSGRPAIITICYSEKYEEICCWWFDSEEYLSRWNALRGALEAGGP